MYQSKGTGQHYVECATCTNSCEFYCNTCHLQSCQDHRDIHLEENKSKDQEHEIVLYQDRAKELPEENCRIHLQKIIDLNCSDCEVVLCSKCFTQKHSGHTVQDLEIVYNESLQQCRKGMIHIKWRSNKVSNVIRDAMIPEVVEDLQKQKESIDAVKKETAELRLSMRRHAEEVKAAVDAILADSNTQVDKIEKTIVDSMEEKIRETEDYVSRLTKLAENLNARMASAKPTELINLHKELTKGKAKYCPETSQPKLPVFRKGKVSTKDIERQFGELRLENEVALEETGLPERVTKQTIEPVTLHLATSATETESIALSILKNICHLSLSTSGNFMASDNEGNLVEFNRHGNQLQMISTSSNTTGYHTSTAGGEWLYTDYNKKATFRVNRHMSTTGDWVPESIYSSHINGDILIGMNKKKEWKVIRYSKGEEELQGIQWGIRGRTLYQSINFITENINGDICVSDFIAQKVVVVGRSGQYRFSYSG